MVNLYELLPEKLIKAWWDSQWRRTNVFWDTGHGNQRVNECLKLSDADRLVIDGFFNAHVESIFWLMKDDQKVLYLMRRVQKVYPQPAHYRYDNQDNNEGPDYWQSPAETLLDGKGDCDDWGILLYALLRKAGIPAYRLKAVVSDTVINGVVTGAHFHLIYLARKDYEWYTVEGTWYPWEAIGRYLTTPHKYAEKYGKIYVTFNEEFMWNQKDFLIKPVYLEQDKV